MMKDNYYRQVLVKTFHPSCQHYYPFPEIQSSAKYESLESVSFWKIQRSHQTFAAGRKNHLETIDGFYKHDNYWY